MKRLIALGWIAGGILGLYLVAEFKLPDALHYIPMAVVVIGAVKFIYSGMR